VFALVVGGANLYWARGPSDPVRAPDGSVMMCPTTGCASPVVIASATDPVSIAADSSAAYWTDGTGVVSKYTQGKTSVLASGQKSVTAIVSDGMNVYWAFDSSEFGCGAVASCATEGCGGKPTVLAAGQQGPDNIAVDSTSVYWSIPASDRGGLALTGSIQRLTPK